VIKKKQIKPEIQIKQKLDQLPPSLWQDIQEHFLLRTMRLETFLGHRTEQEKAQTLRKVLQGTSPMMYTLPTSHQNSWRSGSSENSSLLGSSNQVRFERQMLTFSLKRPARLTPMGMLRQLEESSKEALAALIDPFPPQQKPEKFSWPQGARFRPNVLSGKRNYPTEWNVLPQPEKFLTTQMFFDELKNWCANHLPEAMVVPSSSISLDELEILRREIEKWEQDSVKNPHKVCILPTSARVEYLKPAPIMPTNGIQIIAMPEMPPGEALLVGKSQLVKLKNLETSEAAMRASLAIESKRFERQAKEWEDIDLRIMQAAYETEAERKKRIKRNRIKRAKWRLT
jgi:hypothetical protein